jgi:hypothetical protein
MTFNLKESVDNNSVLLKMIVCVAINKLFIKNTFVMHPFTPETENIEFNEVTKNMISSQPLTA